jgi:hypothetical protein
MSLTFDSSQALAMNNMPIVETWPANGQLTYEGADYALKNDTTDPWPFVIRHKPCLSRTALKLQLDLMDILDDEEQVSVPGRMTPKRSRSQMLY